ncbi:MAG: DUF2007 domain-containing protein [Burkholderiales bacterium]|nr:DUF2007 domain-containing protein [Burkholderiales bacterium]
MRKPLIASFDTLEVHHLKNVLETEGIRCYLRNELLTRLAGEIPFTECALELHLVDESDRWRAERILEDWRGAAPGAAPPWACDACGEQLEAQFTACWRCGRPRAA